MNLVVKIARILIGLVFAFSGFVKAIDPIGSSYKFTDYFKAMGIPWMEPFALILSFLMCAAEFIAGICMIINMKSKFFLWLIVGFMAIFTPLTFWLAKNNLVQDCGCFGDFLKMDNWETFYKNVVIDVFVVFLIFFRKYLTTKINQTVQWLTVGTVVTLVFAFEIYNYNHLPIIDFRAYKEGTNISEAMKLPAGAKQDIYESIIYYKKDGVEKGFPIDKLPDSTWVWVRTDNKLIQEGDKPKIHDFTISTLENDQILGVPAGQDVTDQLLSDANYSFLLIAYKLGNADTSALIEAGKIADFAKENKYNFYCLTASSKAEIEFVKTITDAKYNFFSTDETTLKTIIRSNPGLTLIRKGTVIKHWHYNDFPSIEELQKKYLYK